MEQPDRRTARSDATRARIVTAARRLFGERGYAEVGTNEIVAAAGTTRGGLYYHFADKRELFRAVNEDVSSDLTERIAKAIAAAPSDPLGQLRLGVSAWLDACTEPEVARICLSDGPSVLGWQEWREIDARYPLRLLGAGLSMAIDAGLIEAQPIEPLSHLVLAAMSEAGMMIAHSDDPARTREEIEPSLLAFVQGLGRGSLAAE